MSIVPLHDEENGVIMSLHCFEKHDEHLLPENVEYCKSLKDRYFDHEYRSLMNTTFGLVPAGRSPGTYRLGEVMSAGSIPVFVGRDMVLPYPETFDWSSFSFMFSPDQVGPDMVSALKAVPRSELQEMQVWAPKIPTGSCIPPILHVGWVDVLRFASAMFRFYVEIYLGEITCLPPSPRRTLTSIELYTCYMIAV